MRLEINVAIQIQKTIREVFEGISNPDKMTKYFISESNGRLESGKELVWKFSEVPDCFPVKDIIAEEYGNISFVWDPETVVKITLEALTNNDTIVRINENGKEFNTENLKWVLGNTEGWANFLACLKAYLEYGISLRKGAFDFIKK